MNESKNKPISLHSKLGYALGDASDLFPGLTYDYVDPNGGVWHDETEYLNSARHQAYYDEHFTPKDRADARSVMEMLSKRVPEDVMEVILQVTHDSVEQSSRLSDKAAALQRRATTT